MKNYKLRIGGAIGWTAGYLLVMLVSVFLDITVWRSLSSEYAPYFNIATLSIFSILYIFFLNKKSGLNVTVKFTWKGFFIAVGCAIFFFLLLDNFLDPLFERLFPNSEIEYQETLIALKMHPIINFFRICLLAPIIEEILMRGFILNKLKGSYNNIIALLISTLLFGILHFNMVQTFSAFVCGLILGLIFLKYNNLLICIMAHALYNTISYLIIFR